MLKSILLSSLLSLFVLAQDTTERPPNQGYNGGEDNPKDPSDAGAEGPSKGAFTISKGGLIAIIVVAVFVAVGGSTSHPVYSILTTGLTQSRSCLRRSFLASEEATVGRPTIHPPRLPSHHWPSSSTFQATDPTNRCPPQFASSTQVRQAEQGRGESPVSRFAAGQNHDNNIERL